MAEQFSWNMILDPEANASSVRSRGWNGISDTSHPKRGSYGTHSMSSATTLTRGSLPHGAWRSSKSTRPISVPRSDPRPTTLKETRAEAGVRSFEQARNFARSLCLEDEQAWRRWVASTVYMPRDVPEHPEVAYAGEGWVSFRDWLGTRVGETSEFEQPYKPKAAAPPPEAALAKGREGLRWMMRNSSTERLGQLVCNTGARFRHHPHPLKQILDMDLDDERGRWLGVSWGEGSQFCDFCYGTFSKGHPKYGCAEGCAFRLCQGCLVSRCVEIAPVVPAEESSGEDENKDGGGGEAVPELTEEEKRRDEEEKRRMEEERERQERRVAELMREQDAQKVAVEEERERKAEAERARREEEEQARLEKARREAQAGEQRIRERLEREREEKFRKEQEWREKEARRVSQVRELEEQERAEAEAARAKADAEQRRREEAARAEAQRRAEADAKRLEEEERARKEGEDQAREDAMNQERAQAAAAAAAAATRKLVDEARAAAERQGEEEARAKKEAEEMARIDAEREEEERRRAEEALRRQQEEEERKAREEAEQEQEEARRRESEEAAALARAAEEDERRKEEAEAERKRKEQEEEAREEEEKLKRQEEEREAKRKEEEARAAAAKEEERQRGIEEAQREEAEARKRAEDEAERRRKEEEDKRQRAKEAIDFVRAGCAVGKYTHHGGGKPHPRHMSVPSGMWLEWGDGKRSYKIKGIVRGAGALVASKFKVPEADGRHVRVELENKGEVVIQVGSEEEARLWCEGVGEILASEGKN